MSVSEAQWFSVAVWLSMLGYSFMNRVRMYRAVFRVVGAVIGLMVALMMYDGTGIMQYISWALITLNVFLMLTPALER